MNQHSIKPVYVAAALVGALVLTACARPGATTDAASQRVAVLESGTLTATVSATGNIEPEAEVRLTFQQPGTVAEIFFEQSDTVKKGDVIARLDTTDLELALAQAQASLDQAKSALAQAEMAVENAKVQEIIAMANYSRTVSGARPSEINAARAALAAAQANLDKLKAGPTPEDLAAAEAALRNAEAALRQAQSAYDMAYKRDPAGIGASPAALQLEQATNNYNSAKAQYDKIAAGADAAQIKAAEQQVLSARANLDRLLTPARQFDLDQAEAQLRQARLQMKNAEIQVASAKNQVRLAEIQVKQAQRRLEQAMLKSPIDGVIAALNVKVGEAVGAGGQPAVVVVDLSRYHIDITVDEIDIAKVKVGQEVNVTLDSLPGVEVKGKVARISPTSKLVNGVVSYDVRVEVEKAADVELRSGMTANASIVLDRREGVLLAPNWAVRRDRNTGKTFLTLRVNDQQVTEVEVKTGLRNDAFSEILSGAKAGDVVVAPSAPNLLGQ
ncbi:MAG: efflux RND transporter periplasmic adaptor subunit [Thermoflexales bacterium]|nr:efflux RND transporter periplasmic adaptor subunit [Thermoflexales bacterium]